MAERERVETMGLASSGDGLGEQRRWVWRAAVMGPASSDDVSGEQQ